MLQPVGWKTHRLQLIQMDRTKYKIDAVVRNTITKTPNLTMTSGTVN